MTRCGNLSFYLVVTLGLLIRLTDMYHPADFHTLASWRESDYTEVARSYYRDGMNILNPRVDWRGNTSGEVEMEFPAIPWLAALLYQFAGYHEQILRIISTICSLLGLLAFASLARRMLPGRGGIFAIALFACNGLMVWLSGSIQPESLQILVCILAMTFIYRWSESGSRRLFFVGCSLIGAAILAKAPSALLGFVIAYYTFRRTGWKAAVTPWVYAGAAMALLPPMAWYAWAHHFYLTTGLSLGLSNETHFLSWIMIIHPVAWIRGNVLAEFREVFTACGFLLAVAAFLQPWKKIEGAVIWYASVVLFYVIIADTSAASWATYYHSNSVAPACLLMGAGVSALLSFGDRFPSMKWKSSVFKAATYLVGGLALVGLSTNAYDYLTSKYYTSWLREMYTCMQSFRQDIPQLERIVVRGGRRSDAHGHPVAYNESMAFTWLDRKGFNYAREDYSRNTLIRLRDQGARFWVASEEDWRDSVVFRQMKDSIIPVDTCGSFRLFKFAEP
jgi:4-amino-4-deoxy-L-arabinose transferase-like glycosyltransferase